jgi:hypothetical protein
LGRPKKANILDSDFYLADLFVDDKDTNKIEDDASIRDNLFVIFQNQGYKIEKENIKQMFDATINITKQRNLSAILETLQTSANKRISRTTLLNVEIYLFRKTSENAKEHFLHLDNGLNFHKNICVTCWVKIGKKNIIYGTVPLAQAIFLQV